MKTHKQTYKIIMTAIKWVGKEGGAWRILALAFRRFSSPLFLR